MQGSKTTANLLQREFAKYGDRNGTRTGDKIAVAAKRLENDTWTASLVGSLVYMLVMQINYFATYEEDVY